MVNSIDIFIKEDGSEEVWRTFDSSKTLLGTVPRERSHIKVGDVVFAIISGLFYMCENSKQEKWMNMSEYYIIPTAEQIPSIEYFIKNK